MGRPKPLLPFAEKTTIELLIASLQGAGIEEIVLVLGPGGEAVAEVLHGLPLTLAWNRQPGSDMASSLRLGMKHLGPETTGVLVALADHPLVAPETFVALGAQHLQRPEAILLPTSQGRNGHPVLLPRIILNELDQLPTLREVVRREPERLRHIPVADPGILLDLDTPEDYLQALAYYASLQPSS